VLAWIASQRARGALLIGICSGAHVLSNAGLLRDRAATGHWYDIEALRSANPSLRWVRDRRFVVDRGVVTTTGVTASIPLSLTLVEAIAGRERAETLAREIGVAHWDAAHQSDAFALRTRHVWTIARNTLAFWSHESLGVRVEPGVDEIALALTADAYSRTYRSRALALASDLAPVATRRGLELLPDRALDEKTWTSLPPVSTNEPARALDRALAGIAERYGEDTADVVALQLEYPQPR
jgi:transcriptional regulator GlxA family with amidase domain